jgi:hypothetical protein
MNIFLNLKRSKMKSIQKIIPGILSLIVLTSIISCDPDKPNPTPANPCVDSILANPYNVGLVAYYKFPSGSVNDYSGNGHNGSILGTVTPTANPAGSMNCALSFAGSNNDYISVPSNAAFDFDETTPLSIVLWYKPVYLPGTSGEYRLLIGRDPNVGLRCPDTYGEYSLGTYDCMKPVFGLGSSRVWDKSNYSSFDCDSIMINYEQQGWQNLIAIYDPSAAILKWSVYRNGVLTTDSSSSCNTPYVTTLSGDIIIGKNFAGSIDDIKIYNRVLSTSEINFLKDYISPCCE